MRVWLLMSASLHLLRKKRPPHPPPPQRHCHVRSRRKVTSTVRVRWEKEVYNYPMREIRCLREWSITFCPFIREREIGCNYGEVSTKNLCCTFSTTLLWWRQRMCLWERVKTRQKWCKRSDADLPVPRWDVGMKPVPGISTPCSNSVWNQLFLSPVLIS